MSAETNNLSLIQDEDTLRKLWQDTEDFGRKKEIRSQMYKLREQRLKEFYNSGEITETKTTKTTGKVSQSSTHADSLVDQSFMSLKSKEVRDSESPTREIHYKIPDNNDWQIASNNQVSKDGKTRIFQTSAAVQGSQKIDGGQIDFKAQSEQSSSVYQDANTKAVSNKYQASESSSSHVKSSQNIPAQQVELPSNLQGVTKVTRETTTLPDGSVVITTKYNTVSGASQTSTQTQHAKTSQTSSSSRLVNQNQSATEIKQIEQPSSSQTTTKVIRESKCVPDGALVSTSKYDVSSTNESAGQVKSSHQTSSYVSSTNQSSGQVKSSHETSSNRVVTEKGSTTHTSGDIPSDLQAVTKVTRETKTLPDGSTVTTTRYDTTSGTSQSEIKGNIKVSKDQHSSTSSSTKQTVKEISSSADNRGQNIDVNINIIRNVDDRNKIDHSIAKDHSIESKSTLISTDQQRMHNIDQSSSKITKEHHTRENINKVVVDESDGNKISHIIRRPNEFIDNEVVKTETNQQQNRTEKIRTDNFVNTERLQEQITREKKVDDIPSRPADKPRGRSPTKAPKSEYEPSKPAAGQYDTTYRTDYTNKKISVELSPAHDAFARSLRSVSPDRIPHRGGHRTSNTSLPEKMRHPSRWSPERLPKDRSTSPTKSDRYSSTDTYISNRRNKSPSPKRTTNTDTFKRTTSNETITLSSTNKKEVTRKSNTDIITKSRSPSPPKRNYLRKTGEMVTDLDDDITITTTIREKSSTGTRPTSLEFTKKSKKITDRSPSSPLSDMISPKKSPTKEVRRSSSFKSPTKDSPSPKGFSPQFESPKHSNVKSPTKEDSPSKYLPEDRPLKRTDTYEERCRQILGITEVNDKRRSSLERSLSKRNSFRRNISSSNMDNTVIAKSPTKDDNTKFANLIDIKTTTVTNETKTSKKPSSRPSSRPSSKDFSTDVTLETIITQKSTADDTVTKKNSISEFPSQRRSPTRDSHKTKIQTEETTIETKEKTVEKDKITEQRPVVTSYPDSPTRSRSPNKEHPKTTPGRDTQTTSEFITREKVSTIRNVTNEPEPNAPLDDKPSKKTGITEFPSQKRSPSKETLKIKDDKTDTEQVSIKETISFDILKDDKPVKKPLTEFPSQSKSSTKETKKTETITDTNVSQEKIVTTDDVRTTGYEQPKKGPSISEYPSQTKPTTKDRNTPKDTTNKFILQEKIFTTENITKKYEPLFGPKDDKPCPKKSEITEFPSQKRSPSKETINKLGIVTKDQITINTTEDISTVLDKSKKKEPSPTRSPVKDTKKTGISRENITVTDEVSIKNLTNINKDFKLIDSETIQVTNQKEVRPQPSDEKPRKKPSISEYPSQFRSPTKERPQPVKDTTKVSTDKFIIQEKIATDEVKEDINRYDITETTKSVTTTEGPKKKVPVTEFPSQIRKTGTTQQIDKTQTTTKVDTDDIMDIIDDIIITDVTDDTSKSTRKSTTITEYPSQKRPSKDTTDFVQEVVVTDEFEINITKPKPSNEKPTQKRPLQEYPSQIRKEKPTVTKNLSQGKIIPKEKPSTVKHKITEYPSQTKPDKKTKEPNVTAKHVQPISYEGKTPVEEPICIKRRINTDCPEDEHNKHHVVKKVLPNTAPKKLPKPDVPLSRKPLNGVTEYTDQYSRPKSTQSPRIRPAKSEETDKALKPSNKINISPTKPLVNGIGTKQSKNKETTTVFVTVKPKQPISETIIKKNVSPQIAPKPKQIPTEKVTRITPVRGPTPLTKPKPSQPELVAKKHLVTTTITLKNGHQPKPKVNQLTKVLKEKRVTNLKQQKNKEVSSETDEDSVIEVTENIEVTRKNVAKVTKKPDKKCITTKTVIINNNATQGREIIVDLQRSESSREPTPDRVCPVPMSAENGGYELPRYPDEITEPDDDTIKRKPKRLSDIPLIEYEDTNNFSRITEIVDSHVITERDKVDHTDESLLSVNRKINLFLDTADKLTKETKKPSGPAPKVERPKLQVTKDLESDECLLSVSEKVNKFVNTAEQFVNVHDIPDRPKSPRCRFNEDKVASKTFITKEQSEEKRTRKISLENLDIESKKPTERKPPRTSSPEQRLSPTVDVKISFSKEPEIYPNYKTITKRISLENIEAKVPGKPQEYSRPKSPTRAKATPKQEEYRGRDVSPTYKRYTPEEDRRQSPEPKSPTRTKSPETPKRRPSNEYTSINSIKTTRRSSSPEPVDSTPKTSRSKPTQDKKTILSSTGRLRSTESIQKARALFENISKDQETVRPPSRSPVLDHVTTTKDTYVRKLSYSSEDKNSHSGISRSNSPDKPGSIPCSTGVPENEDTPHYMLPLDRSTRPHSPHRENIAATQSTDDGDIPHYMLPVDRSIRPHSPHTENIAGAQSTEDGDIPHYMLPLDRSIRPHSPHRENIASAQSTEDGDIPHYMLPLDRSIGPHSKHIENITATQSTDSKTTKFGVTLRKTPTSGTPAAGPTRSTTTRTFVESKFGNLETLTEEEIQEIYEVEILEELLERVTSYEIRRIIRTQIRLVKKLISENRLSTYIQERKQSKMNRTHSDSVSQKLEHHSTYSWSERRKSSDTTTKETRKESPVRQQSPPRTTSPIRKLNSDDTTIRSTYIVRKSSTDTPKKTDDFKRFSPETITRTSTERTTTTETRQHSPPRPSSPIRKLYLDETIIRSTYTVRKSSTDKTPEVITRKTEEIRKSSPERVNKSTVEQTRKTSTDRTIYTATERSTTHSQKTSTESRVSPERSPTRKYDQRSPERKPEPRVPSPSRKSEPRKISPDRKSENKTHSILKKTEQTKKKVEETKPEWVTKRNLKKVTTSSTGDKLRTSSTSTSKTVVKQEKYVSSNNCQPTDLITSSYGVGPTDENGTPLFGLKALRTQNNSNNTTKVQGTFIKSEYYSENGQEPVGQISVTKYSTDPRDLSTDEQIENNNLITSVTTTQKFGYEDAPSLETLTTKRTDTQIEDSVLNSDRMSTFKRQNSVKAISQKFIDSTVDSLKNEKQTSYPKAGLILRTSSFKDSKGIASNAEDTSKGVITSTKTTKQTTTTKSTGGGSFLSNKSTISGVQDVISRMKTEDYQEGENTEDTEARSLLNKFLGSQVLLTGMENRGSTSSVTKTSKTSELVPTSTTSTRKTIKITKTVTEGGKTKTKTLVFQSPITEEELENIWDEQTLRLLLEQSTQYEERRIIRNRLKIVMAEQEACAELVEKASQDKSTGKIEETVSVEKSTTETPVETKTQVTKITTQQQITKKPLSPFAKFKQLDKQNSTGTPPSTPGTPKTPGNGPLFKFTDPAVSQSASTIKERLLYWCKVKTKEYENVQLDNFSSSWADGLAFCALIHHFLPDAFDYHVLTPKDRRHNFELAFRVASEKADIFPLLDVDDMMACRKPDWKCVFTYVQSIYRRFKNEEI